MEFWGVEVKAGESLKVEPGEGMLLHISQACFGEVKKDKGNEFVHLYAKKDGQKFVLGNLSLEKFPHLNFDLVFEDDFELLHDWKHGSVHFAGYRSFNPTVSSGDEESDDDLGEPIPINAVDNGKRESKQEKPAADKANAVGKPESVATKQKVKIVEPKKDAKQNVEDDDDDDDEDDNDSGDEDSDEDEDTTNAVDDSDDDEDESVEDDESDEEAPEKAEPSKKRPAESATKTPASNKKAKLITPQKTDGKKASVHVATPHPSKQAVKTSANSGKPNQQTPKSGGSFSCNSCNRSFGSEQALQSHSKAKHGK
ncbi:hypothetical protein Ancab_014411 [Ancistrocladus abbreviatus]